MKHEKMREKPDNNKEEGEVLSRGEKSKNVKIGMGLCVLRGTERRKEVQYD